MRLKSSLTPEEELRELELETRRMRDRGQGSPDRATVLWRGKWWILVLALAAGIATYSVSRYVVSPTYSSSADVVVTAHTVTGGLSDAITASNDLANQYAQVAASPTVLANAASELPDGGRGLSSAISVGTVGDQNLVRVTSLAGSPSLSQRRANAVANAFVVHINAINAQEAADLRSSVERQLQSSQQAIAKAEAGVAKATRNAIKASRKRSAVLNSVLAAKQTLLASLVTQRQAIISDLAGASVQAQPSVRISAAAGTGTQTQPKPVLYAAVAAIAMALAVGQILILVRLRRRD
jgi:capsular polysaccharide biosynthesis protein